MNDKDESTFATEQSSSSIHIPLLLTEIQQEKNEQYDPYFHCGFLSEDSPWLSSSQESSFLYDAFYSPYGINSGISLQSNEIEFGLAESLQHSYELGSPFSYYSNDRIIPTQQRENNSEVEGSDNSFPSAFIGWSPICNQFQVHPTGEAQSTQKVSSSSSFENFPYGSNDTHEAVSVKTSSKLKYSDVVVKPPSPKVTDNNNIGNFSSIQDKSFSNSNKSPRKKTKESIQSSRVRAKQNRWLDADDHSKLSDFCDKAHSGDIKDTEQHIKNGYNDDFDEWCNVTCLSNDCSNFNFGLEEITLAKQNREFSRKPSVEQSAKKASESFSKSPNKVRKAECKHASNTSTSYPGQKSEFEWGSFVLNNDKANNLQSSSKTQNPKRTLNINNNLGASWQSDSDKIKNFKVYEDEEKSSQFELPKKTAFTEPAGTKTYQRNCSKNGIKSEKPSKDTPKKNYGKKKKDSKPILDLERTSHLKEIISAYLQSWGIMMLSLLSWLFHLIADVSVMSAKLSGHMLQKAWLWTQENGLRLLKKGKHISKKMLQKLGILKFFYKFGLSKSSTKLEFQQEKNISLPVTGEEAMKRLLACKGKDPYSILGVTPSASDDDIKKYYRRQAVLVHPDKNRIPGAEEAFKTLAHAFELIGEPEKRKHYHSKMMEESQLENAWHEFTDLLNKLHEKMEEAANTIKCTNCNNRHKRIRTERPCYCARYCATCKVNHAAREGDIWAESSMFGFLWHYYACMDSAVFDITEWAACQANNLKHLQANTHNVQYRIVSGRKTKPQSSSSKIPSESEFEEFLSSFYGKTPSDGGSGSGMKSKTDFNKKKRNKKKKL